MARARASHRAIARFAHARLARAPRSHALRTVPCRGQIGEHVPPGGSVGEGGVVLDRHGEPVLNPDGTPEITSDP